MSQEWLLGLAYSVSGSVGGSDLNQFCVVWFIGSVRCVHSARGFMSCDFGFLVCVSCLIVFCVVRGLYVLVWVWMGLSGFVWVCLGLSGFVRVCLGLSMFFLGFLGFSGFEGLVSRFAYIQELACTWGNIHRPFQTTLRVSRFASSSGGL